ncbi:hypothetical protein PR048_006612 [Dryococelus australis]|uniref:Glucosylceramidase n=1 Tax=Dryococelus australis TaxID=614101 RepID=A0ABQ9IBF6_9NEOP|nr:hypothetical protein PR048_006612 [Dryococelus australis]
MIVNSIADDFYKQPMFYALAHFSKFVPPGSVRIGLESEQDGGIENVAFLSPDNITVVIMQNKNNQDMEAALSDSDNGQVSLKIPANSMHTILFK